MTRLATLLLLVLLTGCSSFQRDWRAAGKRPVPANSIEGRWEGTWKSNSGSHSDKLRCLVTRISDQEYEARFHAKYKKVLSFGYTATFRGEHEGNLFKFSVEADLGKLAGGVYRYKGEMSPTNFVSTYDSKYDRGVFHLQRPD